MDIDIHVGGFLQTNGYLVTIGDVCFAVDAPQDMAAFLKQSGRKPSHLLLTHQHFDHTMDAAALEKSGLSLVAERDFDPSITISETAIKWGLPGSVPEFKVSRQIQSGNFSIGEVRVEVRSVPGHSPDSIVFYLPDHGVCFSGDTVFQSGIGRSDLPGGNHEQLISGIRGEIFSLPPQTRLLPGHGPETTVAAESGR